MAAISKALAASLDQLADSIAKAETYISTSLPTAAATSIIVKSESIGSKDVYFRLEYRPSIKGLVKSVYDERSGETIDYPLMEVSVADRQLFGKSIPEFIAKATEAMNRLPLDIAKISGDILAAVKSSKESLHTK